MSDMVTFGVFGVLFVIFVALGFYGAVWRKGDLRKMNEWALAGRNLGTVLVWFLVGADLYTAYTFVAVPSGLFAKGSLYFFAVPYVALTFGVAMITMPSLWKIAHEKNYITAADFAKDKFQSPTLGILIAITGIVALLPYIALQIVGMQAVLTVMLINSGISVQGVNISDVALVIAFIILAAFVYTSGLRGATLTAVMKDALIFLTVIVIVLWVPYHFGGFQHAFVIANHTAIHYATLPGALVNGYLSLAVLSAFALYLYPHAVNGALSAESPKKLRMSTALLPIYGIGLALLALFGVLIYDVPAALQFINTASYGFNSSNQGIYVVPALIQFSTPDWFTGIAFLGIFIGGLVPAAIMAMAQANLVTRNIILEFVPTLTDEQQTTIAKWMSVVFKFLALSFVFFVPLTYAIQLQLLGGVLIVQTLPPVFIGLYTKWLNKWALIIGWVGGIGSGLILLYLGNLTNGAFVNFHTSFFNTQPFGLLYVGLTSLVINLILVIVFTFIFNAAVPETRTPAK